jgi:hypothetical protein
MVSPRHPLLGAGCGEWQSMVIAVFSEQESLGEKQPALWDRANSRSRPIFVLRLTLASAPALAECQSRPIRSSATKPISIQSTNRELLEDRAKQPEESDARDAPATTAEWAAPAAVGSAKLLEESDARHAEGVHPEVLLHHPEDSAKCSAGLDVSGYQGNPENKSDDSDNRERHRKRREELAKFQVESDASAHLATMAAAHHRAAAATQSAEWDVRDGQDTTAADYQPAAVATRSAGSGVTPKAAAHQAQSDARGMDLLASDLRRHLHPSKSSFQ